MAENKKGSNKASFDQEALSKLVGKPKNVPTQEVVSGMVTEEVQRTTLQIPSALYVEFKRNYLLKYNTTLKDFVISKMTQALEEEK